MNDFTKNDSTTNNSQLGLLTLTTPALNGVIFFWYDIKMAAVICLSMKVWPWTMEK